MTKFEQVHTKRKWVKLNYEIEQHQRVIRINSKSGQIFSEDYLQWLDEIIQLRDSLTDLLKQNTQN